MNQSSCTPTKAQFTPQKLSAKLMNIVPILNVLCQELLLLLIIRLSNRSMVGLRKNYILILDCTIQKVFLS